MCKYRFHEHYTRTTLCIRLIGSVLIKEKLRRGKYLESQSE